MKSLRIIAVTILIFISYNIPAIACNFHFENSFGSDSTKSKKENESFAVKFQHPKNKLFIGYGFLPAQEKTGVFNSGYILDIYKKMSLESSLSIYSNNRYSLNAITYFHASIPENQFDLYLGGGLQLLKIFEEFRVRPILSVKGDINFSSKIFGGISFVQPFFPETAAYSVLPSIPFLIVNVGYKF